MVYPTTLNQINRVRSCAARLLDHLIKMDNETSAHIADELEALVNRASLLVGQQTRDQADSPAASSSLVDEQSWLEVVLQALPVGVWITDASGRVVRKNRQADAIWAGDAPPPETTSSEPPYQFRDTETGQRIPVEELPLSKVLSYGKAVYSQEMDIQRFDGTYATVLAAAAPVWDRHGELIGVVGIAQDITAQKQLERWLRASQAQHRESELRFQLALNHAPIVVFEMDQELRYTWIYNPEHRFTLDNVVGKRNDELLDPESAAALTEIMRRALETGEVIHQEVAYKIVGQPVVNDLTIEPLRDNRGEICGLIGAAMDLTRIRELESRQIEDRAQMEVQRQLQEHRELERQEIAREIHDGPIQSLLSAMFNLQAARDSDGEAPARQALEETYAGLKKTVQELREVVNELRPPALIRFGLSRAVQMYAEDLRARHPQLVIELELIDDERLLPEDTVLALYRVCQEGLMNVVRHARAQRAWVRYYSDSGSIVLEIQDDGAGFTLPGDWVNLTRHKHFGLAGMRERADAVGGQLSIQSAPGQGTTIILTAPLQSSNE